MRRPVQQPCPRGLGHLGLALLTVLSLAVAARAQTLLPPDPARVVGKVVAFDGFVDENGADFSFSSADQDGRPWIVSPMYTRCPHTCSAITSALRRALEQSGLAESEYHVLSFSFDPNEDAEGLRSFRAKMNLPPAWITLRARDPAALERTLRSLDFRTITLADGVFEHPNLVAVLAPDRRLASYVFGVNFVADELARAVRRARDGVSGFDRWRVYLFFFAAVGFVASAAVFVFLLARRRARPSGALPASAPHRN